MIASLVEAKGVMTAAVAGTAGMLVLKMSGGEAIQFGALCALGASLGDAVLTGLGQGTVIATYMPTSLSGYLDPLDFVGAAAGVALLGFGLGMQSMDLAYSTGIAAVSAGIAPKLAGEILTKTQ
jgi:hypothetical protein